MQSAQITLWCPSGLSARHISVELDPSHDRCQSQPICEEQIGTTWDSRVAANPSLYNGAKFRLAGFEFLEQGDGDKQIKLMLGITDYKDYIGTNLSPQWESILNLDASCPPRAGNAGRSMLLNGEQVCEADARSGTCLANTCANAAVLQTKDDHIIYMARGANVGECAGMMALPGGHAEPSVLGFYTQDIWQKESTRTTRPSSEQVVNVLWEAVLLEVEEETGVGRDQLGEPLLLGCARRVENHRPVMCFLVNTDLSAAEVIEIYKTKHVQDRFESTSLQSLPRLELLSHVLDVRGDASANHRFPGCHVGCLMLYRSHLRLLGLERP